MGCHTWFYRKIEITQQEANENFIRSVKKERNLAWKIYRKPESYGNINWVKDFYNNDLNKCLEAQKDTINFSNIKIKGVSNGNYQKEVWYHQDEFLSEYQDEFLSEYIEGKGLYIDDTGFHDVFRKYGYPDDKLFSLDETLSYINNPENNCEIYENTIERLKEFWNKYPDGMIMFG